VLNRLFQFLFGHSARSHGQTGYLVEIRLYGPAKKFAKDAVYTIARRFRVSGNTKKRAVPHVTLYGPFSTNDQARLVSTIKKVCESYSFKGKRDDLVMYRIAGFKAFHGASGKVVCLDIISSKKLYDLTDELADELNRFCKGQPWDMRREKLFHSTIAFRDIDRKHDAIMSYLSRIRAPLVDCPLLRLTILRPGGKILCEYDLIQNRIMNRDEALDHEIFRKSVLKIKEILNGQKLELSSESRIKFSKKRSKGNVKAQKRRWRRRR